MNKIQEHIVLLRHEQGPQWSKSMLRLQDALDDKLMTPKDYKQAMEESHAAAHQGEGR